MDALKKALKNLLKPLFRLTANRDKGLRAEVRFWDTYFAQKGSEWPEDYVYRLDPNSPITGWHKELVDLIDAPKVSILDVGAGPLTVLGKRHATKILEITPVDPLADAYEGLFAKYGIRPVVKTQACAGEKLVERFGPGAFDLVMAQNSIDHSLDPMVCIAAMVEVCKIRGVIGLRHAENEAENEAYRGLHQWNLSLDHDDLIVIGKPYRKSVDREFGARVRWTHKREGNQIVSCGRKLA